MDIQQVNTVYGWLRNLASRPNWTALPVSSTDIINIKNGLIRISQDIEKEFPFFSRELFAKKDALFIGWGTFDPLVFGQVTEILKSLQQATPIQDEKWALIHPLIVKVSQKLFADEHYSNAACDAFIEINDRVKRIYKEHRPEVVDLPDGQALMNKVFADKDPILEVCDLSDETGRNIQLGTRFMLAGAMAALRNPKAHANVLIGKEDAMRRIMLASLLMYKIDNAVKYTNEKVMLRD